MFKKLLIWFGFIVLVTANNGYAKDWPTSNRSQSAASDVTSRLTQELKSKGLTFGDPVFIRLIKSAKPSEPPKDGFLEVFTKTPHDQYTLFKTYPICRVSGTLGPKTKMGDGQAPEGFYYISKNRLNPWSRYHLSMNLGYPNPYDRAHGYTGDYLMIHGNCVSIGCFAMTNAGVEDIYTLVDAALRNGQKIVRVHSYPFAMTQKNLEAVKSHEAYPFWKNLKSGWDWFETHQTPPDVTLVGKTYRFGPIAQ